MGKQRVNTGAVFIEALERASEAGDADHIARNMPRLEALIARLQEQQHTLAQLHYRARVIRDRHEAAVGGED